MNGLTTTEVRLVEQYVSVLDYVSRCAQAIDGGDWFYLYDKAGTLAEEAAAAGRASPARPTTRPAARAMQAVGAAVAWFGRHYRAARLLHPPTRRGGGDRPAGAAPSRPRWWAGRPGRGHGPGGAGRPPRHGGPRPGRRRPPAHHRPRASRCPAGHPAPKGLTFTNAAGCRPAGDYPSPRLDRRVRTLLVAAAARYRIRVSCLRSGHSWFVKGTRRVSNHSVWRGVDLDQVDGRPVSPANPAARRLALWIGRGRAGVQPSEVGSPWAFGGRPWFTDAGHQGHLHVGFAGPTQAGAR